MRGTKLDHLLREVQRPARYVGGEWNEIVKEGERLACRMALCYPDIYEVGMSHLGSRILYEVANRRPDTACERAFVPWPDRAGQLRECGSPLASLETRTPLGDFDLVGITLQHELNYPGIVTLLELGRIPVRASERDERHPLVIGGGPCAASPEPVAPFFDAFVIGDGEEALGEIIDLYVARSGREGLRSKADREALLLELAKLPGVYVPLLYDGDDGRPAPRTDAGPETITRRILADLDEAPYPLRPIVPFVEIVHDRAQLEINRGCTHGCRFCQAGMLYRPVRQRSLDTLRHHARAILEATGYEQISLSSLSCTDYPHIVELVDAIAEEFGDSRVSISLPSLRTDQFGIGLAQRVSRARKSPVTLAPEAGSQRLRDVINKNVTEENLREAATAAFRAGWHAIKLYFMIGLPTETDDDVRAIAETVKEIVSIGRRELKGRRGRLRIPVTVSGFVPKPHSVFETELQCSREELHRKHRILRDEVRDRCVELKLSSPDQTALEGILARGGRRLAPVIEHVARGGVGLESWGEWFSLARWEAALAEIGAGIDEELRREVGDPAESPWGHIDTGITAEFRAQEMDRARASQTTPDCRDGRCVVCGLQDCCEVAQDSGAPQPSADTVAEPTPSVEEQAGDEAPVCRAIVTFAKEESARYLSHLDVSRALQRAARRAGLPIAYTQGFNQRPRMTIARPLPVGVTGDAELCAIDLLNECSPRDFAKALHPELPEGLALRSVAIEPRRGRSPFARIAGAVYAVALDGPTTDELAAGLEETLASPKIEVERKTKRGQRTVDIRPGIFAARVAGVSPGMHIELACTETDLVKPEEVVEALNWALTDRGSPPARITRIHRECLIAEDEVKESVRDEPSRVTHAQADRS